MIRRRARLRAGIAVTATCLGWLSGLPYAGAQSARRPSIVSVCAPFHGFDGRSANVEIPNLAGQPGIYLREQLLAFRAGTRRHPQMGLARGLTDREINELVGYFSILPPP